MLIYHVPNSVITDRDPV